MKKFIDTVNKKELLVSEELYFASDFTSDLYSEGIHVVTNEYMDYSDALEDICEAFNSLDDELKNNYFRQPTEKELLDVWNESGFENEPFDKELATGFYYDDCVRDEISENSFDFLDWLDSVNKNFTYISLSDYTDFVDLIEYHPYGAKNELLEDTDYLEKVFFKEWYSVFSKDSGVEEKFSLDNSNMLDRYMFEKYNAIQVTK